MAMLPQEEGLGTRRIVVEYPSEGCWECGCEPLFSVLKRESVGLRLCNFHFQEQQRALDKERKNNE